MMTESRRRRELIMPITELRPGTWAVGEGGQVTERARLWGKCTHLRRRSCGTGCRRGWTVAQQTRPESHTLGCGDRGQSRLKGARTLAHEGTHSRVSSAMRWLLSIRPRSASSESVTDAPVAVLKALCIDEPAVRLLISGARVLG